MQASIIIFPGSNCDRDVEAALYGITGYPPHMVWYKDQEIPKCDLIVLPGGFSFGDYLRAGAIAAKSPILKEVKQHAEKGVTVIGICNGFQILTETGILPGSLMKNKGLHFICKPQPLKIINSDTIFTRNYQKNRINKVVYPIAHIDGNFRADSELLKELKDENRIVFEYAEQNPNGSSDNIAGILNKKGNVLGLMPHPERAVDLAHGGTDGRGLFQSLMEATS